jgi:hypothetical protein
LQSTCYIDFTQSFTFELTSNLLGIPEEIPPSDEEIVVATPTPHRKLVPKRQKPKHTQVSLDSSDDDIPLRMVVKTISKDHVLLRTPSRHARGQSSRERQVSLDSSSQSSSSNLHHEPTSSWSNLFGDCQSTLSSTLPLPSQPNLPLAVMEERFKKLPLSDHSTFFHDLIQARKCFHRTGVSAAELRHCIRQLAVVGVFPGTEWLLTMAPPKIRVKVLKVSELLLKFLNIKESSIIKGYITLDHVTALTKALKEYKAALI